MSVYTIENTKTTGEKESIGISYAHCKIIYDSLGRPIDCLILEVNDTLLNIVEKQKEEVIGRKTTEVFPSEDWPQWMNTCEKVSPTGQTLNVESYKKDVRQWMHVSIFSHKPGYVTFLIHGVDRIGAIGAGAKEHQSRFNLLVENQNNQVTSILNIGDDITEKRELALKLQQSQERCLRLMEAIPDGAVIIRENKIIFANRAAAKLIGAKSSQELLEMPFTNLIYHEDQEKIKQHFNQITSQESHESPTLEIRLVTASAELLTIELLAIGVSYGASLGIICNLHDITERKRNEELKSYIEEKERFLEKTLEYDRLRTELFSNISHEFKTPLNVILGTLQLIELYLNDNSLTPLELKISKKINMMQQNCYRLLRLVNNLIDMNKIDSGYLEINLENNDIAKITEVIAVSVKEYIENKGIAFEYVAEQEELYTACDPDKIERIILNLLSNSIKFTKPDGKIMVSLKKEQDMAILAVKDTGIGIPPDKVGIIFDRFSQLNESLIRKNEGSGIGLSLVKSLVELHGGKIEVNSHYGVGTEFIIQLPIRLLAEHQVRVDEFTDLYEKRIEKINIEFSDIYFHR